MRKNWCKVIILVALVVLGGAGSAAQAQIRLSEVLSAPASDWDGDGLVDIKLDEWIEVTNTGATAIDLSDLYVRDGTGTAWHYGFSGSLAPGASVLVTGAASVQWQSENAAGSSGLSLNNTGDLVELVSAPAGGVEILVDSVQVPGHAAAADRAMAWQEATGAWTLYDALNAYAGDLVPTGTGCAPSPGQPNICNAGVPVEGASVGRLKAVFDDR